MSHSIVRRGVFSKAQEFGRELSPRTGSLILVAEDLEAVEAAHGGAREEKLVPGHGFACV